MRKLLVALTVVVIAGAGAVPAAAHEGHASCQAMGELVSGEAQDPAFRPFGKTVSGNARGGPEPGIAWLVELLHEFVCTPRP
jgi:hypothetical protein